VWVVFIKGTIKPQIYTDEARIKGVKIADKKKTFQSKLKYF